MRVLRWLLALILVVAVAAGGAIWWATDWLRTPIATLQEPHVFDVTRGATLRAVAYELKRQGFMDRPQVWIAWARLTGRADDLRAGEYQLQPGQSPRTVLELLSSGDVLLHSITFIEGSTFADMRRQLRAHEAIRNEYAQRADEDVMRALNRAGTHPEGQFFPDTYRFARGTTDVELLAIALGRMSTELEALWQSRDAGLPLATSYEALILASIVEKETGLDTERPAIAGVFIERLRRGMRLQTDPTVIYGMQAAYEGNIRRADLQHDTPYNTYTRSGLPPTPIAMPGLDSLRAAVHPQTTGAIFFVATGDGDGSHYFSKTLAEHNAAVQRYLRKLRQRPGS